MGTITTSVRNTTGAWEIIERESGTVDDLATADISAQDIGGEVGQELLIELRNADDQVIGSTQILAS